MTFGKFIINTVFFTLSLYFSSIYAGQLVQELPMYGEIDRSNNSEFLEKDKNLIATATRTFGTREHASQGYVERAFDHYSNNEFTKSMSYFNQAWLLDSENPYSYLGFGLLMNEKENSCEAYKMFKIANEKGLKENGFLADFALTTSQCALLKESDEKKNLVNKSNTLFEEALRTSNKKLLAYIYNSWAKSYFLHKDISKSKEMIEQSKLHGGKIDQSLLKNLNSEVQ